MNPFRFIGQVGYYLDPDRGEYYVRARVYSPSLARWSSNDRIGFDAGVNLLSYVLNSPNNRIDPSGLAACKFAVAPNVISRGCGYYEWGKGEVSYGYYFSILMFFQKACGCCEYRQYATCQSRARYWNFTDQTWGTWTGRNSQQANLKRIA